MTDTHFYEPANGHGLRHDPFKAIVAPRPIGWISTVDAAGAVNLAPYSFFNAFSSHPPILGFAGEKLSDTIRNARDTGAFVYNVVNLALAERMSATSYAWPHGIDEMTKAGIAPAPCRLVAAPRVAASPASFECKVLQVIDLTDLDGAATNSRLVLGQVVGVHIDRAFIRDGVYDTAAAEHLARCGSWGDYAVVRDLIRMRRPDDEAAATLV
jgi:flavin reductase (DIM6/NTAB) family NADH-FMN oxidoreductase RutF